MNAFGAKPGYLAMGQTRIQPHYVLQMDGTCDLALSAYIPGFTPTFP